MRSVYVGAPGMTPFGRYPDMGVVELGALAAAQSLRALPERNSVQAAYVGCVYGGSLVGQRITRALGYSGLPVVNVENACASSGTALHLAVKAVASGELESALVLGAERLSALGRGTIPVPDDEVDARQGVILPALYAMRANRYLHETDSTVEDLCAVVVKNRRNGARNPLAHQRSMVGPEEVNGARMIADPLTKYHCCPNSDGAASVVVSSRPVASSPVRILASVLEGGVRLDDAVSLTDFATAASAAAQAYEQASLGPRDISVAEVHDAFSIAEILYYEAFGWAPKGEGFTLLRSGATQIDGRLPVSPSGGLLARGHPLGASGVAQVVEVWKQLSGVADGYQVESPRTAFCQVSGGGISGMDTGVTTVHILTL